MKSTVISIIVPIITAILGYIFGILRESYKEKRSKLNLRFEKLYNPFQTLIMKNTHGAFIFSDLNQDLQKMFYDLLIDQYMFADKLLKSKIMEFRWIYDDYTLNNRPIINPDSNLNIKFYEISVHIFEEYNNLCSKLYFPKIKM